MKMCSDLKKKKRQVAGDILQKLRHTDNADDLALLTNTRTQVESQSSHLEQAGSRTGLNVYSGNVKFYPHPHHPPKWNNLHFK